LQERINYPIVAQVTVARQQRTKAGLRVPLLVERDKRHMLIEAYRNIRSSILFSSATATSPRSLLISSAAPGEGKSTVASNLAITFAFAGARTLLIDADLRRGILHELFNLPASPGLSETLRDLVTWRDAVQTTHLSNLDLLTRGKVPHHAGELLLSDALDHLLTGGLAQYDIILWDSAPLLAADDAANLCSKVDGVLFIARIHHSSLRSVDSALDILVRRNARIFGVVLNSVRPNQPGYHDRYRYKEYYATGEEV
jgi:capsular exopolysaccharide synthesis family protein